MDKNIKPNDFKYKQVAMYTDDDCKPSTSGYNNRYQDQNLRDPKRTETKKRIYSRDEENRDYNLVHRKKIKVRNENRCTSRDQFLPQQQTSPQQIQPIPQMPVTSMYPNYGYNALEHYNVESNQGNYPMLISYNAYYALNNQSSCNQVDPMCMPPSNMQVNAAPWPVSTGIDMASNMNGFHPHMPVTNDMYMMGMSMVPYPMYTSDNMTAPPVKEKITLTNYTLFPPLPGTRVTRNARPPGCKTVYVGRLPKNIAEELIREIFGRCGEIDVVRMHKKKNLCHVRFTSMETVDNALMLSGYRLKIGEQDDNTSSGCIHVDFAKAQDDEHEWKCQLRTREREIRHRERSPTPPSVVRYSEHEANLLCSRLKDKKTLKDGMDILVTWLNRGECKRKTCGNFYSMIQCMNNHVKRILNKKNKLDEVLKEAKLLLQERFRAISLEFYEITKFYDLVKLPNVWDIFNRNQKKILADIIRTTSEIMEAHSRDAIAERVEDEMELSDDDAEEPLDTLEYQDSKKKEEIEKIKVEIAVAQNQLQNILQQIAAIIYKKENNHKTIVIKRQKEILYKKAERDGLSKEKEEYLTTHCQSEIAEGCQESGSEWEGNQSISLNISQDEILLIILMTSFLKVHPFGASSEYICSYLQKRDPKIKDHYIENLLQKYANTFEEKTISALILRAIKVF